MSEANRSMLEHVVMADSYWGEFGKSVWMEKSVQDYKDIVVKSAFLKTVEDLTIVEATSLVIILNTGVEMASNRASTELGLNDKEVANLNKRIHRQAHNYATSLLKFIQRLKQQNEEEKQELVTSYTVTAGCNPSVILSQLTKFSEASMEELRLSLVDSKGNEAILRSFPDCYGKGQVRQERDADALALQTIKKRFRDEKKERRTPRKETQEQPMQQLLEKILSVPAKDAGRNQPHERSGASASESGMDGSGEDYDNDDDSGECCASANKRGRTDSKMSSAPPPAKKRALMDPSTSSQVIANNALLREESRLKEDQENVRQREQELDHKQASLNAMRSKEEARREQNDIDFASLRKKQKQHDEEVAEDKKRVAADRSNVQELQRQFNSASMDLAQQSWGVEYQRQQLHLRQGENRRWRNDLSNMDRDLSLRLNQLNRREDELNLREQQLNQREQQLNNS